MNISRFVKEQATPGHNNTILAGPVLPQGMAAPFGAAWGYLENRGAMEAHRHPTAEIYIVIRGHGRVLVDAEWRLVEAGDVIEIPPNALHTMACADEGPLLWAALWWPQES